MKDDFDNIRAERETPYRIAAISLNNYAGLWKQIALGIVVGHLVGVDWCGGLDGGGSFVCWGFADRCALGFLACSLAPEQHAPV
ncbi:hypothetical protein [Pseudomonas sp. CBC3]|uniref:hypothetical protein n=1 Tax=Pseudomonas sp. CBC3 TaxID=3123318 RepID=UPI0030EA02AD